MERLLRTVFAISGTRSFNCYQPTEKLWELRASVLSNPENKLPNQVFTVVPSIYTPITSDDFEFIMHVAVAYEHVWWLIAIFGVFSCSSSQISRMWANLLDVKNKSR